MPFKYKTSFSGKITKVYHDEIDKLLATASLDALKSLFPSNIDLKKNIDLIGCVFNGAVAGRMNANGDSLDAKTAIAINKFFYIKPLDISHDRSNICGVICNTGYSKFGSNELLTEEQASELNEPFNMAYATVIYKTLLSEELIQKLEDSADESSDSYGSISTSWELYYNDYDIAIGSKNVNECQIITDEAEKAKFEDFLLMNGGSGKKDGKYVYRVIKGDFLIPAGMGLVENPAAEVKGIALIKPNDEPLEIEASVKIESENISLDKSSVITNKEIMKITSIKELNEETLKECTASSITDMFDSEIKKANEKWEAEKVAKENQIKELETKNSSLAADQETLKKQLDEVNKKLTELVAAKDAQEAETKFNCRMESLSEEFELDNEERAIIVADIKDMTDEQFEAYAKKMKVLMKNKTKKAKKMMEEEEMKESECNKKVKASIASETVVTEKVVEKAVETKKEEVKTDVVAAALATATPVTPTIPNGSTAQESTENKYKKAFSFDACVQKSK